MFARIKNMGETRKIHKDLKVELGEELLTMAKVKLKLELHRAIFL